MQKSFLGLILLLAIMLSTGCSIFGPVKDSQNTYMLTALCPHVGCGTKNGLTLLVQTPQTIQAFNTTQMAYVLCPYQLSYFSSNAWADTPPQMLMPLMVQALQDSRHFHAVVMPSFGGNYDLLLNTQLIMLQQEFTCHPSRSHIVLRAQLINNHDQSVLAACQFDVAVPAACDNPYGGVIAANKAVALLLSQLTEFVLRASADVEAESSNLTKIQT